MKSWKLILGISLVLITLMGTGIASANLVQGQVNPNGTLWIISYQTPTGTEYPQPFNNFHANNLSLLIYSPLAVVSNASITVKSFNPTTNTTEYENQSFTVMPRKVQTFDLLIPPSTMKQEISITYDNNTVVYYIQTFQPVQFPFGNSPLGLLALVGILMLTFTALNIGLTQIILNKAKYFPKLSQRAWIGLIVITGLIIYNIATQYYYDLTGEDWAIWLIPLWFFNLLMILSAWKGKDQDELYIHIRESKGKDLETGIYAIKTAPMNAKEESKYNDLIQSGKEYIDNRSYTDFIRRLAGKHIIITMDTPENPDQMQNPRSERIRKITNEEKEEKIREKKPWKMIDRPNKERPFSEAYLLDPKSEPPKIQKIPIPEKPMQEGEKRSRWHRERKAYALQTHLNGKHMQEAEYFLSNYITASESGKEIHRLNKELATNQSELNTKAYKFQHEVIDYIFDLTHKRQQYNQFKPEIQEEQKNEQP